MDGRLLLGIALGLLGTWIALLVCSGHSGLEGRRPQRPPARRYTLSGV